MVDKDFELIIEKNQQRMSRLKTWVEQLASFKRSNKLNRAKKAKREGFDSVNEYMDFLKQKADSETKTESKAPELTDMVIAFDTTGSMRSYINDVKRHVNTLIPQLFEDNPNLKLSIVAFGDYCDMRTNTDFGNAYQVCDLTDNANVLMDFVTSSKDTGGGDYPEFYELVIRKITQETNWRKGSNKSVLFIADAVPHDKRAYQLMQKEFIDWEQEAREASKAGVKFDTLRIDKNVGWYKELSSITNGVSLNFQSSGKTNDLVRASALARGGESTVEIFRKMAVSDSVKSDTELTAVYTMYKSVVE